MIIRVDDNLTTEQCAILRRVFDERKHTAIDTDYMGWPLLHLQSLMDTEAFAVIHRCLSNMMKEINARLGIGGLYAEAVLLTAIGVGGKHPPHADNCQLVNGAWVPNHTPHRTFTCMQYLNSDFGGGEIHWPDRKVTMKPKEGMFIAFPSDREHVHEVFPVSSGFRYSLAVWLTDNKEHELCLPK